MRRQIPREAASTTRFVVLLHGAVLTLGLVAGCGSDEPGPLEPPEGMQQQLRDDRQLNEPSDFEQGEFESSSSSKQQDEEWDSPLQGY